MHLYPRLRLITARALAEQLAGQSAEEARKASSTHHPEAAPAPTGGQAASQTDLAELQMSIRDEATRAGYPDPPSRSSQQEFDVRAGRLLLARMNVAPAEAANQEVWAFLGCVLLPDLVRWRFGPERTSTERFTGGARGIRNTFGRLWWRAYLLEVRTGRDGNIDPLELLNEDELVQITERPGLSGYPALASALAHEFLAMLALEPSVPREALMRQAAKRLLRTLAFVAPEAMEPPEVVSLVQEPLAAARHALLTTPTSAVVGKSERAPGSNLTARAATTDQSSAMPSATRRLQSTVRSVAQSVGAEALRVVQGNGRDPLLDQLQSRGLEVVDRRRRGGRLWVIGGGELESELAALAPRGARFIFVKNGARSTRQHPGWYLFDPSDS